MRHDVGPTSNKHLVNLSCCGHLQTTSSGVQFHLHVSLAQSEIQLDVVIILHTFLKETIPLPSGDRAGANLHRCNVTQIALKESV